MATQLNRPRVVRQTITLRPDQLADSRRVVVEEERHGNLSRYIQDLIDADLAKRAADREPQPALAS